MVYKIGTVTGVFLLASKQLIWVFRVKREISFKQIITYGGTRNWSKNKSSKDFKHIGILLWLNYVWRFEMLSHFVVK